MTIIAVAIAALATTAASAALPQLGATVGERSRDVIPVRLSCPAARVTCAGTASFKGKKRHNGRIYRLEAASFDFAEFEGGRRKTIHFRLSDTAKKTLTHADGMRVEFVIRARYGAGKPGTVRVRARLAP
jgi:hypothetical protein